MNLRCVKTVALVAVCVLAGAAKVSAEEGKRIAVVNVSRVFALYDKVRTIEDTMKKMFDTEKKSLETEDRVLRDREDAIKVNPKNPETDIEFFQEIQRLELDKKKFALKVRDLTMRLEKEKRDEMKKVLNEIKLAIRSVGAADGFDLVLRAPEFEDEFDPTKKPDERQEQLNSAAELVRKFRENPVLYFSQGVDVTEKVTKKLNDDFKASTNAK